MNEKIIVFENLVQPHSSGIVGQTQNVKAKVSDQDMKRLSKTSECAKESARRFRNMFGK